MKTVTVFFCLLIFCHNIVAKEISGTCLTSDIVDNYILDNRGVLDAVCEGSMTCLISSAICELTDGAYNIDTYSISYVSNDGCEGRLMDVELESMCDFNNDELESLMLQNILCINSEVDWVITPNYTTFEGCSPIVLNLSRQIIWESRVLTYIEDLEDEYPVVFTITGNNLVEDNSNIIYPGIISPDIFDGLDADELEALFMNLSYLNRLLVRLSAANLAGITLTSITSLTELDVFIEQIENLLSPEIVTEESEEEEDTGMSFPYYESTWGGVKGEDPEPDSHDIGGGIDPIDFEGLGGIGDLPIYIGSPKKENEKPNNNKWEQLNNSIYPNPFQQQCIIQYELLNKSEVSLVIYNATGQQVATLMNIEPQSIGVQKMVVNMELPEGIYTYHLTTSTTEAYGRMVKVE